MFSNKEDFKNEYLNRFKEVIGDSYDDSTMDDKFQVLASLIMKYAGSYMADTNSRLNRDNNNKRVYYFSMEFLIGKLLIMNIYNLGIYKVVSEGLEDLGLDLQELEKIEVDPGLGSGGLGRLAACFMDSLAFLNIPSIGMGLRYRYGSFQQKIIDNQQVELPNRWLQYGYPWEIKKTSQTEIIKFYGNIKVERIEDRLQFIHENYEVVTAVPYDIPQIDFDSDDVNYIRIWSAENTYGFDLELFNNGDYLEAVKSKANVEAITHILYPSDSNYKGRLLRLKQQYFFVSAGLKSIIRRYKVNNDNFDCIGEKVQIQINDTHPSLVIPELMRIFIDEEGFDWDYAWTLVTNMCSYTNHTILAEALEKWPIDMMKELLPRVYMIIEEIDRRFVENTIDIEKEMKVRNSILRDGVVHMANLAIIGSKSVNGVSKLHGEIIKKETFKELYKIYPWKFNFKTNGVSHRRFLMKANPPLSKFLDKYIGEDWKKDASKLQDLERFCEDKDCTEELFQVKRKSKEKLAKYIKEKQNIDIDVDSIFDLQIKRIHEYKRQLLNVLHIMHLYEKIKNQGLEIHPRTFIFAGKAAPSYRVAKKIIRLINTLAEKINKDPEVNKFIKVVFVENFNVSIAELLYASADVSEQISTASKEASGTGNMKFMMNGALTIGTLDGANVEISERVGEDNIFIFGLKSEEVIDYYNKGGYCSYDIYNKNKDIKRVVDHLVDGFFKEDIGEFDEIYDNLIIHNDSYFVIKDFEDYIKAQREIQKTYKDKKLWFKKVIKNISQSGYFSSDRTILDYDKDIWKIK